MGYSRVKYMITLRLQSESGFTFK